MQASDIAPRDRLIVALDLPSVEQAEAMVARLGDAVTFYKIGYQLAYAGGLPLIRKLADQGKKVFLDLKLHDIGNTIERGVESIVKLRAAFLTVHAYPQTMKAAVQARAGTDLKILAVTVLTSYDDGDLHAAGYRLGVSELVDARAQQAQALVSMVWSVHRKRQPHCASSSVARCSWLRRAFARLALPRVIKSAS